MTERALSALTWGSLLVGLSALLSFWASPDKLKSLPWVASLLAGAGLTGYALTPLARGLHRRATPERVTLFFLLVGYLVLTGVFTGTRWPAYKLSWLSGVYAALPSIRSLPFFWASAGIQPNQAGGTLAVFVAFALAIAFAPSMRNQQMGERGTERRVSNRVLAGPLAILGTGAVFLTGSRAALAGLFVALLLIPLVRGRRPALVCAGVLVLGGATAALLQRTLYGSLAGLLLRDETIDTKMVARLDIWISAFRGLQDHPLTGIGVGVFNDVIPVRYPYETVGLSYAVSQAHNMLLDTALALGLVGLLGFLLVLVAMFVLAGAHARAKAEPVPVFLAILASCTAFSVFGLTDSLSFSAPSGLIVWMWGASLAVLTQFHRLATQASPTRFPHLLKQRGNGPRDGSVTRKKALPAEDANLVPR